MFKVVVQHSEIGQRNPAQLERLAKEVLQRTPDVMTQLSAFAEQLGAKLKQSSFMDPNDPLLNRGELEALRKTFSELKHGVANDFAVIMALSELGQRNPAHLEKLATAVLQRTPKVGEQLTKFGEQLGAKLKSAK